MVNIDNFDLKSKTILITGAAGLLGFEHSKAVLAKGAKLIISDINLSSLEERRKELFSQFQESEIIVKELDVTNKKQIQKLADQLSENEININVLINNAAIDPKVEKHSNILETSRLENYSETEWDLHLNVGLKGAFLCSQVFGSKMAIKGEEEI